MRYSKSRLDKAYSDLTEDQQYVLDNCIRRGMKTKWLNAWAKKKGTVLSEEELENPDETMKSLLEWILLDYTDFMTVRKDVKCECGRSLRYRYQVLHTETGQIFSLGRVHFEQHTGLEPEIVSDIIKGLKKIDLERDEILTKIINGWRLGSEIPEGFEIPKDMIEQLSVGLPLLDRQALRLNKELMVYKQNNPLKANELKKTIEKLHRRLKQRLISQEEAETLYRLLNDNKGKLTSNNIDLAGIKHDAKLARGKISKPNIRKWLVEISYIR